MEQTVYELLEALEGILNQYEIHFKGHADCGDTIHAYNISQARAAIEKAKETL
jgi:hypothetical protein